MTSSDEFAHEDNLGREEHTEPIAPRHAITGNNQRDETITLNK